MKGDIIVKVNGARIGCKAIVTEDQGNDDCVRIDYSMGRCNDPDYSPESYCQLVEPDFDYEMD